MSSVPSVKNFSHDPDGCRRAELRTAILRQFGQIVFYLLQVLAKKSKPRSLFIVAEIDIGLKCCLITEQLVVVGLVGTKRDIERRIEIHPGQVALDVVVASKRLSAPG